ncbi:hypothetical protein [Blastococcus sp. VKM Ac-2987]|uniref:hypothetical protein n=1 Tax=Blastococcus sp. VKM Ac-2987 TaxID=3004141 RepID=UPI0022AB89D4|nr:hypothetical protein [Blastococcus sp. VKM Ac-2987]MCZ2858141.1 hypothetical protein [Blastococcus sp. VKM Ac-2987]
MASTVLDTLGSPYARSAGPVASQRSGGARRRVPVSVLGAGLLAVGEATGLLATGLTRVDAVLAAPVRPAGWLVVLGLVVLAGWIVLTAGAGAALIDGSGRTLVVVTSSAELGVLSMLGVVAVVVPVPEALTGGVPLPLLFAAALAVPAGKLLLAGTPSARQWVLQGPRVRARRPDPVTLHRSLCTVTLGLIALALGGLALLGPVDTDPSGPATNVVSQR